MKKLVFFLIIIITVMSFIASCTHGTASEIPTLPTPPPVSPGDEIAALVNGNSAFTFDLYRKLKGLDGNFFFSPYSISSALAMTYAGASENTAKQMANTLHFALAGELLHTSFSNLDQELKGRSKNIELEVLQPGGETAKETVDGFRLNIVNALWGQKGYTFLSEYLNLVKKYYGGDLNTLDFINKTEEARLEINKWASEQTEGRINDLLPPGAVDPLTRLVLTNAIYFKAQWEYEFAKTSTLDDDFYLLDGSKVTVPLMHQQRQFSYAEDNAYQAVRLPYLGNELGMVILLPREGKFTAFENSLDAKKLNDIIAKMESREVRISLPKFKIESSFQLGSTLSEMGMPDAFAPGTADFSGMTGNKDLSIGAVIHKTFVSVDELGTEAAAVTAITMVVSIPMDIVDFTVNRPFIFLIQDIKTGTILFIGRVLNPAA